jgi:hypothetical protein
VRTQIRRLMYRHGCGDTCGQPQPRRCPAKVGGITEMASKTERGKRGIGLPPQLLTDLRAHRQAQLAERLAAGSRWQDDDLVFCQPNGKPIDARKDWLRWRDLLREPACVMPACTTRGTRPRRCSSRKESRLASSWRSWATPPSR